MDREQLIKKAREIVHKNEKDLGGKATQLQNLRELVRSGAPLEEIILYIDYQRARGQLPDGFARALTKYLDEQKKAFRNHPDDLKYFIGNLVRAGMIYAKQGG